MLVQVPAALRSIVAILEHRPVVTRLAGLFQRLADNTNMAGSRLGGMLGKPFRVISNRAPGRFIVAEVLGYVACRARDIGVQVATLLSSEAAIVFDRPEPIMISQVLVRGRSCTYQQVSVLGSTYHWPFDAAT